MMDEQPPPPRPFRALRFVRRALLVYVAVLALSLTLGVGLIWSVKGAASGASLKQLISLAPLAEQRLTLAHIAFTAAQIWSMPLRPLAESASLLPGLEGVAALAPALDLSVDATAIGARSAAGLGSVLGKLSGDHGQGEAGMRLLGGLQQAAPALTAARQNLGSLQSEYDALAALPLPGKLHSLITTFGHYLPDLDDALNGFLAAPQLLGADSARDYLLVPENPWDLRATGGFVGTVALLEADHGKLSLAQPHSTTGAQLTSDSSSVDSKRPGYIAPPLPLLLYEHFGNWFYRDANWLPDFPSSAALLRYFYGLGQGHQPDGVIAFDSSLLSSLLQITGPISVPGLPHPLDASTGVQELDSAINASGTVQKSYATQAYTEIFRRLKQLDTSGLAEALKVLGRALNERHLLIWIPNAPLSELLARRGWDGGVSQTNGDYLYLVDTNVHYNKINQFVDESISDTVTLQPDGHLQEVLSVLYKNNATLARLRPPQNNTQYEDFIRLYVPAGSHLLSTTGFTQLWPVDHSYNRTLIEGYLRLPSLQQQRVTIRYDLPIDLGSGLPSYQLTVQKQPGTNGHPFVFTVQSREPGVRLNGYIDWRWNGTVSEDTTLSVPLPLTGQVAQPYLLDDLTAPAVGPGRSLDQWTVLPTATAR